MKRRLTYEDTEVDKTRKVNSESNSQVKTFDFDPVYFIRCHSRKNDDADVGTQVWQCAFEPQDSKLIATCGGNSVCIINIECGNVEGKYYSEAKDYFYALCWTRICSLKCEENILAVGGTSRYIHLLHPDQSVVFFKYNLRKYIQKSKKDGTVSSLLFHPHENNLLFCSQGDGDVIVFDIGCPLPPGYKTLFAKLYVLSADSEIFSLAFSLNTNILLAACNKGLRGWKILEEENMENAQLLVFEHPPSMKLSSVQAKDQLVDSVEVLCGDLVATKCVLHGNIYVWNLMETVKNAKNQCIFQIAPSYVLKWKDTDNYFMNMGFNKNLLVCGDDKGALWIYDVKSFSFESDADVKKKRDIQPNLVLQWPKVEDSYLERKRKVRSELYDIVIDKVAVSPSGCHIVAVTSNNMVCIWKNVKC